MYAAGLQVCCFASAVGTPSLARMHRNFSTAALSFAMPIFNTDRVHGTPRLPSSRLEERTLFFDPVRAFKVRGGKTWAVRNDCFRLIGCGVATFFAILRRCRRPGRSVPALLAGSASSTTTSACAVDLPLRHPCRLACRAFFLSSINKTWEGSILLLA